MKIDLQTLEESIRNQMLELANNALQYDGRFSYQDKQYIAKKLKDTSIEIEVFKVVKYKIDTLPPEKKQEFKEKIDLAKQSSDPADRKFKIEDVLVEVREIESGKFTIHTSIVNPNTV
jgi:hypothetical protein